MKLGASHVSQKMCFSVLHLGTLVLVNLCECPEVLSVIVLDLLNLFSTEELSASPSCGETVHVCSQILLLSLLSEEPGLMDML